MENDMEKIQQAIVANIGNRLTQQLANGLFHDIVGAVSEIERGYKEQIAALQTKLDAQGGVVETANGD